MVEPTTFDGLKKKLASSKGRVTRVANGLEKELSQPELDIVGIEHRLGDLQGKYKEFEEILAQLDEATEDKQIIDEAAEYLNTKTQIIIKAKNILSQAAKHEQASVGSAASSPSVVDMKLPKLNIGKFSGSVLEWTPFRKRFEALIDRKEIPKVTKFS